jgi:plastocyanin
MLKRIAVVILTGLVFGSCGGSSGSSSNSPSPSAVMVSIVSGARTLTTTAYSPNPVTVPRGSTVTWTNNDTSTHDQIADNGSFNSGDVAPGAQGSVTFQTAGTIPYHCGRHPNMVGTIIVQ